MIKQEIRQLLNRWPALQVVAEDGLANEINLKTGDQIGAVTIVDPIRTVISMGRVEVRTGVNGAELVRTILFAKPVDAGAFKQGGQTNRFVVLENGEIVIGNELTISFSIDACGFPKDVKITIGNNGIKAGSRIFSSPEPCKPPAWTKDLFK